MKDNDTYGLTWTDVLFGLTGSTIFILILQFITGP